jgi:hypothetical protein
MTRHSQKEEAELKRLLRELNRSHSKTLKQLDSTDRALDAALRYFAHRRNCDQRTLGAR